MMAAVNSPRASDVSAGIVLAAGIIAGAYTGAWVFMALPALALFLMLLVYDWKGAWWVMLCTIPLSMEIYLSPTLSTSLPDEPMMWLFFLSFLAGIASNPKMLRTWWWQHPLTLIIAAQLVWLIVAVCSSRLGVPSLKYLVAKCWTLACFFVLPTLVFRTKCDFKKAFLLLLIPVLATMLVITVRHAVRGFSFVGVAGAINGIYLNHVEYSSVVSMFLPIICIAYPLIDARRRLLRALVAAILVFFVIVVLLTYARAAILGLLFAGFIVFAIRRRIAHRVMPACYAVIASVLIWLVPHNRFMILQPDYKNTFMHSDFSEHMAATFRGHDLSSMERLYRWIAALRMSRDEPLTGFGPHAFYHYYKPYALTAFRTYTSGNPEHSTTHNYFLLMLTEQGWPAMLLYALLMAIALRQAQDIYHRFHDRFYKSIVMGIAALLAVNFVNNFFSDLIETHKVGALFYLALALLIVLDRKSREQENKADVTS